MPKDYEFRPISLSKIVPDQKFQFRTSPYDIASLAESISKNGLRVPLIVRERRDGSLDLLAGHNRVRALRQIGKTHADAKVYKGLSDEDAIEISISDNLERQDLTPWDIVYTAAELRKQGRTNAQIGQLLKGVTPRTVQRYLKVAAAPEDFRKALMESKITIQQAYEALSRGLPLSQLTAPGQSIRLLREMSRTEKSRQKDVTFRRARNGKLEFRATFTPNVSDLDELIDRTNDFLAELMRRRAKN